jgi:hypothetical protein
MAAKCHISISTTFRIIHDIIHAEDPEEREQYIDYIYLAVIKKRRSQAWRMYHRLCNERYKNYTTTDDA